MSHRKHRVRLLYPALAVSDSTKRRLSTGVKLNVICNGNVIESKSNVTYLGVTLDQFLSGEIIASNILYKSSNKLKFLYRNARKFNLETKNLLISALIQLEMHPLAAASRSRLFETSYNICVLL